MSHSIISLSRRYMELEMKQAAPTLNLPTQSKHTYISNVTSNWNITALQKTEKILIYCADIV